MDEILKRDYASKTISNLYFLEDENIRYQPMMLFSGCVYGFKVNGIFRGNHPGEECIVLSSLKRLINYINSICVQAENALREDNGIPRIGEGWITETDLYYKIKNHYSEFTVLQHYHDSWLGNQHLDVYIKELNVGIEYQGAQHYRPIEIFGGEDGFIQTQKRDKAKVQKCKKNGTRLVIVNEGYDIDEVIKEIDN